MSKLRSHLSRFKRQLQERLRARLYEGSVGRVFSKIYENPSLWGATESASGSGSDLTQTSAIRIALPELIREMKFREMLDAPCGDFYWMSRVDLGLESYIGLDIVAALIEKNRRAYSAAGRAFLQGDIVKSALPQVDLILCRDCLVHLPFELIDKAVRNFIRSGSQYLLTTTFPRRMENVDVKPGEWRPLNLELPPLNFPPPLRLVNEQCTEGDGAYRDKSLGLWKLDQIRTARSAF